MHTVGDTRQLIGEALKRAIGRADFVLVTGGLGPTSDDLTNEAAAEALGRPATLRPEILEKIRAQPWGDACCQSDLERLAWLPEGAEMLNLEARTCGHLLVHDSVPIFFLPGVPGQAVKLLTEAVLPRLSVWREGGSPMQMRLYRTTGLPECEINRRLLLLEQEEGISIGYYPVESEVHVSLTVSGAEPLFADADMRIRAALGGHLYGTDKESLAEMVGLLLLRRGLTLAVAESCTGGLISAKITAVPGCSAWFAGGVVAYSNQLKEYLLDVDAELLRQHGAVSAAVAEAMAAGIARRSGAAAAVAVTGIAGPDGGTAEKPVGTVYIGLHHDSMTHASLRRFSGSRNEIQEMTATAALDAVRLLLKG
jgi:nicotinamide-nucleotide amidase